MAITKNTIAYTGGKTSADNNPAERSGEDLDRLSDNGKKQDVYHSFCEIMKSITGRNHGGQI
ncbi:MAG: hypothetical protein ACJ77K_02260 [Bacteroidia bacterium]